jgi:D-alanyl-D-alanine carboxypeptidase (penicillin-binding protein 5/6)
MAVSAGVGQVLLVITDEGTEMTMIRKVLVTVSVFSMSMLWLPFSPQVWSQARLDLKIQSKSAVLMDGTTGQILYEKNPEERFIPASLVKMMTLYLALDAVKRGEATFDQEVVVSKRAWKMGGSQMFLEVGDKVTFIELIKGVAAISANDAALAIAESLTGSEEVFVHEMNEKARSLGLKHTRFANPHGLPRKGQETSAVDMASLGFHYLNEHPDALEFHSLPTFSYRGIKQKNWNPLLGRGKGVDGLKTGYLRKSGYHFLFSAKQDDRRLVGIVMGAETPGSRNRDSLKLLGYGFKNFTTLTLVKEGDAIGTVEVPNGDPSELGLSAAKSLVVTVRKKLAESVPLRKEIPDSVEPPVSKGSVLGKLVLEGEGFPRRVIDLVADQDVRVKSYTTYYVIGLAVGFGLLAFGFSRRRLFKKK